MDTKQYNDLLKSFYPYTGYNFCMILDGVPIGFKTISGLTLKNEKYTAVHEGGDNKYVTVKREPRGELNALTLQKGVGFFNPSKMLPCVNVMLLLGFDDKQKLTSAYAFSTGYIQKVTVSDFDAAESKALIDTTVILYDFAIEIDIKGQSSFMNVGNALVGQAQMKAYQEQQRNQTTAEIAKHNAEVKMLKKKKQASAETALEEAPLEY